MPKSCDAEHVLHVDDVGRDRAEMKRSEVVATAIAEREQPIADQEVDPVARTSRLSPASGSGAAEHAA